MNELLRRRKRLHELEVMSYTMQIINSLKYLHAHRIIHRDLKLGNLFLNDKMEIKLGDFGLATKLDFDGEKKRTICGTPNYIAPEVLEGKAGHSYEVDVWSLGVIIYTLIIGKPPFETADVKTTYKRIRMNAYSFPEHVVISEAAKDLISKILIGDPTQRPTLDDMLQHEWLNNGGTIPKTLPQSFLACPPSSQYIKQFMPAQGASQYNYTSVVNSLPQRLESTAPANPLTNGKGPGTTTAQSNRMGPSQQMMFTDRGGVFKRNTVQSSERVQTATTTGPSLGGINAQQFYPSAIGSSKDQSKPMSPISSQMTATTNGGLAGLKGPNVWVTKWVDYSSKYGLGYLLSNQATGVFFNDSTKIVIDADGHKFFYYERKAISTTEKQDVMVSYTL